MTKRSRTKPVRSRPNPRPAGSGARTGAGQGAAAKTKAAKTTAVGQATFAERAAQATPTKRSGSDKVDPTTEESTTHRGVRWHRSERGTVRWWNADAKRWVRYRPGADAPPRPPGWATVAGGGPATNKAARASWRSPYRLIPLGLFIVILVIGILQATKGSGGQAAAEAKASAKLTGKCLARNGTANGHPKYSATAEPCSSPRATVKVIRVLPGTPGSPGCPAGETALSLPYSGVRYPHVECVVPAHPAR